MRVTPDDRKGVRQVQRCLDRRHAQLIAEQLNRLSDDAVERHFLLRRRRVPDHHQERLHDARRPLRRGLDQPGALGNRPFGDHLGEQTRLAEDHGERIVQLVGHASQKLADRGQSLAPEQGLALSLELPSIASPLRDVHRDPEHRGPTTAEHPSAMHVQVDDGAIDAHRPEPVPDRIELASDAPSKILLHHRAIVRVDDVERSALSQELVRGVAEHSQGGLVQVDETVVGGQVDADQRLLDQSAELRLRFRQLGRAILQLGHDLIKGARQLPGCCRSSARALMSPAPSRLISSISEVSRLPPAIAC